MIYINKNVGFVVMQEELGKHYGIGETLEDFNNGKYILLSPDQEEFMQAHDGATCEEVFKMKMNPVPEPSLEELKHHKLLEIERYDAGEAVNQFVVNTVPMWLDKQTRSSLQYTIEVEEAAGVEVTKLWYEAVPPISFDIPISKLKQMLAALEQYAKDTYDTTQSHKASVFALETKDEVMNYDYQAGYPEKLVFTI